MASDISTKPGIYARADVAEYRVIGVTGRRLLVHESLAAGVYTRVAEYRDTDTVAPTFAPAETTPVSALLS